MKKLLFIGATLALLGAGCAGRGAPAAKQASRNEAPAPRVAEKAPAAGEREKSDLEKSLSASGCPITPEVVRARCGIPAEIRLTDYSVGLVDSCGVALDTSSGKTANDDPLGYWQQAANASYPFLWVTPATGFASYYNYKAPTVESVKDVTAAEARGQFYRAKVEPEEIPGLGTIAFYARKLWSKEDGDNGRKDAGFIVSVSDGKLRAVITSGGADLNVGEIVITDKSNIKFKQLGVGCDRAEVEAIARDLILPHLRKIEDDHERSR